MSRVKTSFVLHSKRHRQLYPKPRYPLTHLVDQQNVVRHHPGSFPFLKLTLCVCVLFPINVYRYTRSLGPFHLDQTMLTIHPDIFDQNPLCWSLRKEYFQVELGEDNIRNPPSSAETIRQISGTERRRDHIATLERVSQPWIYVKLSMLVVSYYLRRFSSDFRSFTTSTFRCVVERLAFNSNTTYERWIETNEYVQFINDEYGHTATRFNSLVSSRCGVLIECSYQPMFELVFLPKDDHQFQREDVVFEISSPFTFIGALFLRSVFDLVLPLSSIIHLCVYLYVLIRVRYLHWRGLFTFPLEFSADLSKATSRLGSNVPVEQRLLQLDSYLNRSEYRFRNQMFVIEDNSRQLFAVILQVSLDEPIDTLRTGDTPFVICPVTDIQRIVYDRGICYGRDASWIPWPSAFTDPLQNHSEWLHEVLMEVSAHYRQRYENWLQNFYLPTFLYLGYIGQIGRRQDDRAIQKQSPSENDLSVLIREEFNMQYLRMERQGSLERILQPTKPASARFIAQFRKDQRSMPTLCDADMASGELKCTICFEPLQLNEPYGTWPCASEPPHRFHSDCMLKLLRVKNSCPLCRHPVEASAAPIPYQLIRAWIARNANRL